jgi:hypothetical protein
MQGGRFDFDDGGTYVGGWEVSPDVFGHDSPSLISQSADLTARFIHYS